MANVLAGLRWKTPEPHDILCIPVETGFTYAEVVTGGYSACIVAWGDTQKEIIIGRQDPASLSVSPPF